MKQMTANDTIVHYGVKGMKWGIRRYQNPDGTLTEAGKNRANKEARRKVVKERKEASKNRVLLSDEELRKRVTRLEQERKLKNLTEQDITPGRTAVRSFLTQNGKKILASAAVGAAVYLGHYAMTGKFDPQQAANYIFPNPNKKK